jgi:hypothetical protein
MWIRTAAQQRGSGHFVQLTVSEKFAALGTSFGALRYSGSRSSPLPQSTGDEGRGCGDASRVLLFCLER